MNLEEIKKAVEAGRVVRWKNARYRVVKDQLGQFLIDCDGGSIVGLTWLDGVTLSGEPADFYIDEKAELVHVLERIRDMTNAEGQPIEMHREELRAIARTALSKLKEA